MGAAKPFSSEVMLADAADAGGGSGAMPGAGWSPRGRGGHLAVARLLTGDSFHCCPCELFLPRIPRLTRIPPHPAALPFGMERRGSSGKRQGNFIYILLTWPSVTPHHYFFHACCAVVFDFFFFFNKFKQRFQLNSFPKGVQRAAVTFPRCPAFNGTSSASLRTCVNTLLRISIEHSNRKYSVSL